MDLANLQALVFDVFGTVVDWRAGVAREAALFLQRYAPEVDPSEFADAWRLRYAPSMELVRSGQRPFVRLDVLHRENLLAILPAFGLDPGNIPAEELDQLNLACVIRHPLLTGVLRLPAQSRRAGFQRQ